MVTDRRSQEKAAVIAGSELRFGPLEEIAEPWPLGSATTGSLLLFDDKISDSLLQPVRSLLKNSGPFFEAGIEAGEGIKSLEGWQLLTGFMERAGLDRDGVVVVAGGGSLGDAGGFAASTWHRGVSWVAIPTTLLAMVDAYIGGKTAINLTQIKNRVGTFHPPAAVLSDVAFLDTLEGNQLRSGWVEMFKAAFIGDEMLFEELCNGDSPEVPTTVQIARAVGVKARIVSRDPHETGDRELLNFGHTLGHALESVCEPRLLHGDAVATGLIFAAMVATEVGLADAELIEKLATPLVARGLPLGWAPEQTPELLRAMEADKKQRGGKLRMVLPLAQGRLQVEVVSRGVIESLLRSGLEVR